MLSALSQRIPGGQAVRPLIDLQVQRDGPLGVFVPQSTSDFVKLGLPVPDYLWLCQDATGNLAATIGPSGLTQNASGSGYLYQQSMAGWLRKFVGFPEGNQNGFYTFGIELGTQSLAIVTYAAVARPASGVKWVQYLARGLLQLYNTGSLQYRNTNFTDAAFATPHGDIGTPATVRPFIWYRNVADNQSGALTDLEHRAGVHDESAVPPGGSTSVFGGLGGGSVAQRGCWGAVYVGANAERDWKSYLQMLGWPLAY